MRVLWRPRNNGAQHMRTIEEAKKRKEKRKRKRNCQGIVMQGSKYVLRQGSGLKSETRLARVKPETRGKCVMHIKVFTHEQD